MTISLYSATVPTYLQILPALSGAIDKAEAHCQAQGIAPSELITAQIAPDMWNFALQVRAVCMHSALAMDAALAGEMTLHPIDPPADFTGLRALIAGAMARVGAVKPDQLDAVATHDTVLRFGQHQMAFVTEDFLLSFALPNFSFHASAAYCILRMKGVPLSKGDFLGATRKKEPAAA